MNNGAMNMNDLTTGVVNIHGKDYKTVALRLKEFRLDHPDYSLVTDLIERTNEVVVMRASVLDKSGQLLATGFAEEYRKSSKLNQTSALENCESSAVGRALAFLGYGGTSIASAEEVLNAVAEENELVKQLIDYVEQYINGTGDVVFECMEFFKPLAKDMQTEIYNQFPKGLKTKYKKAVDEMEHHFFNACNEAVNIIVESVKTNDTEKARETIADFGKYGKKIIAGHLNEEEIKFLNELRNA